MCVYESEREAGRGSALCCNILFIALAIKCTLGAFVTIFRHTQQWQQLLPIPLFKRSPLPFCPLFPRLCISILSQVKILQHHA